MENEPSRQNTKVKHLIVVTSPVIKMHLNLVEFVRHNNLTNGVALSKQ